MTKIKIVGLHIFGLFAIVALFFSVRAVFAQNATADLTFNPSTVSVGSDNIGEVVVQLSGDQGISAFTLVLVADNAEFTAINDTLQVSGGNADASDFSEVSAFISDDKKTVKISYAITSLDDEDLPTQVSISVKAEKVSAIDGTISVDDTDGEMTGVEGVVYSLNPTNQATLTGSGGGGTEGQATLQFSPEKQEGGVDMTYEPSIIISSQEGISGFNVVIEAQNGIIEEIGEEIQVSGGDASATDFSKDLVFISDDGATAKVAYTNSSLSASELPTEIRTSVRFKRTGTTQQDGIMSFSNNADVEVIGAEQGYSITRGQDFIATSDPQPSITGEQQASPTPDPQPSVTGQQQASPTADPSASDCQPYWNRGDANCSGPKADETDYEIWKTAFVPMLNGGPASLPSCIEAGNIKTEFTNDNVVDLADFEVWRRGAFGTVTNPEKTWPQECM